MLNKVLLTGAYQYTKTQLVQLKKMGLEIDFLQNESEPLAEPEKYDIVICNGLFLYHRIEDFKNLKYIQLTSAGYDRVPIEYITSHNIKIYNARGVYSIPMAEWAVLKALELYKKSIGFYESRAKQEWQKRRGLLELFGKTVVIAGCGSIGIEAAKRFKVFGTRILGVDLRRPQSECFDEYIHVSDINDALPRADILVLTLPLTKDTYHLINAERLDIMKHEAVVINISRGKVVDEPALTRALMSKKLFGAALDVFEEEPLSRKSPLWQMDNVIITPHNSFVGDGNHDRMFEVIIHNLKGWLDE